MINPALRPFAVSIRTATAPEDIFDGDKAIPFDGLVVVARPLDIHSMKETQ